jgi:S-adenosyl-L-methionine hydrolase (adenosine-forming)
MGATPEPPAHARPEIITFLSDYGHSDEFAGVCRAVIARLCPRARVIDITHGIPRHDVRTGALALAAAVPYLPAGVHMAVVDPGVGARGASGRRAVALRAAEAGHLLVGPDNGLLMPAAARLGGVVEAVDISDSPRRLAPLSRTFHGRDLFAPVAAALAGGEPLAALGQGLAPERLRALELPRARIAGDRLLAHVLHSDHFGNLVLDASAAQLAAVGASPGARVSVSHRGRSVSAVHAATFAEVAVGELLIYEDAQRMIALAVNQGSAAERLGAVRDDELCIGPA